ncbi:hypothetical protein [Cellulomonas fimi]|uniref:Uncharacterized protein n=1 Tax=Cellulomonas fimi TaxID=1708 RepID=A0A7Y0QJA4_CELFI|nr:hypothetical protein [Cellulomonas fimi]NMR21734.1 hypothetical protein [Cellulomonas fimi]
MDVKQVLADAWEAVEGSGVPEGLHAVAFEQAVRLIARPEASSAQGSTPGSTEASPSAPSRGATNPSKGVPVRKPGNGIAPSDDASLIHDEDAFFETFASESHVDAETLRRVYYVKDGRIRIGLTKRALGKTEADSNRTVATLLAGVRWYVNGDPALKIGEVRDAAGVIGYQVSRNLSKHLEGVSGTQAVGSGNDKAIRVQRGRFDEPFQQLIDRLTAA